MKQIQSAFDVIQQSFVSWWYDWVTVAVINIAWVFCTLTVVLAPPALFALVASTRELLYGRSIEFGDFVRHFKRNVWLGWRWAIINIVVIVPGIISLIFYSRLQPPLAMVPVGATVTVLVLWLITQAYAVPYLLWQDERRIFTALRNGFVTFVSAPLFTVIVLAFGAFMLVTSIVFVAVFFLGGPAFLAVLGNHMVRNRLEKFGISTAP